MTNVKTEGRTLCLAGHFHHPAVLTSFTAGLQLNSTQILSTTHRTFKYSNNYWKAYIGIGSRIVKLTLLCPDP